MFPAVTEVKGLLPPREDFEEFETLENLDREREQCPDGKAIAGLVLRTGDAAMNTIDYFECRKITSPEKMSVDTKEPPTVETMPPEACPENRVLVGLQAYSSPGGSTIKRWINPPVLKGICYLLKKFVVDYSRCENVTASLGPWIGEESRDQLSIEFDTILYCPVGSLGIGMSRELDGESNRIVNLMCCFVNYVAI